MKKIVFAALALLPALTFAVPGAYVQAQAGISGVDPNTMDLGWAKGFIGSVGAGYLLGGKDINYGAEVDAQYYPHSKVSKNGIDRTYKGYNISLLGVLKYTSCSTGFTAFGKAGGAYVHQQLDLDPGSVSASDNTFAPEAALGVGYAFNPNLEVDLTADEIFANLGLRTATPDNNFKAAQNGSVMLGVAYHFA